MKKFATDYAYEKYGTEAEYLWKRDPQSFVLRREDNQKWYAVFMNIKRERIGISGEGTVDIAVVKCEPMLKGTLLAESGVLPAYHMNKDKWITIMLDGSASETIIKGALDMSYELAGKKR